MSSTGHGLTGDPQSPWGRIAAFVVPAPGDPPTLDELIAFLRDERRIARQKLPEHLTLLESMPMTASGKVQKFVLRERLRRDGSS